MERRFDAVERRFEPLKKEMDRRFEGVTRRIDRFTSRSFATTLAGGGAGRGHP